MSGLTIAQKVIRAHLIEGDDTAPGNDISLRIDQTLTQDATGTMAYLALENMGISQVKTERSVAYIDHNTLQCGFENADDHHFIQSVANKYGIVYSRPGNGICHQTHLERFGAPGKTLLGSDSHTPTGGGLGMLAMGAGGMDVAVAMAGGAYHIRMPKMMKVNVTGSLRPFVTAKDMALELLRRISVKGGVGYIIEWTGEGVERLSVPERATIANMGTETGATTTIFASDEKTRQFLKSQGREACWAPLFSDPDAKYDLVIDMDLDELHPLIACPHSPDNVVPVRELADVKVDQVCIGSCTNSSLRDLESAAAILRGKTIADSVSLSVSPGSRQVLTQLSQSGALNALIHAGARILECACGPCIGMGFSPNSGGVSVRTFNRNFLGRSGTKDGQVYLCSPETAAATALTGKITDPETLTDVASYDLPADYEIDDSGFIMPADPETAKSLTTVHGPNIKPLPTGRAPEDVIEAVATLKVGDNITTDHIMPAGAKILPYRSNVPKLSEFCFSVIDDTFAARAKENKQSVIIGGSNYGQGSSREHAALVPLYLGVRAIVVKSFARIHAANLINAGILPLTFKDPADYDKLQQGDRLILKNIHDGLENGSFLLEDTTQGLTVMLECALDDYQRTLLKCGGLMKYMETKNS